MKALYCQFIFWVYSFIVISGDPSKAQIQDKFYATKKGAIAITFVTEDTAIIARSNELFAFYHFETNQILLKLDLTTLFTGIDSLDEKIQTIIDCDWQYKGKIGISYLKDQDYSPKDFTTEGYLSNFWDQFPIKGYGTLFQLNNDFISFNLAITFMLDLEIIGIYNKDLLTINPIIQIDIWQAVLARNDIP